MRKVLGVFALIVVAIIGLFCMVVAMQSSEFKVERSLIMNAPAEKVFEQVNDFHHWEHWSPWAKLDPNATAVFEGATAGEGAKFSWSGNDEVGEGTMTILESQPDKLVRMRLDFRRPMEDTSEALFSILENGDRSELTWTMSGKQNFVGKAVCMFMDMDKLVGEKFEEGLSSIKKIVEAEPAKPTPGEDAEMKPEPAAS